MIALSSEQQEALASRHVMRRFFIWCEARDPDSGLPDPAGFWDDVGDITFAGRTYHGSGSVISIGVLGAKGDMTIPGLEIVLSGIDDPSNVVVRGKAIAQAPISVHVGIFDPANHTLIGSLVPYFVGFIDDCTIRTPEAGGNGQIVFTCESASRALTRTSELTRSHASEAERDSSDDFYKYANLAREVPVYFGRKAP